MHKIYFLIKHEIWLQYVFRSHLKSDILWLLQSLKCMDFIHCRFHNVIPSCSHSPFTHKTFCAIAYFPPPSQDNLYSHLTLADPEFWRTESFNKPQCNWYERPLTQSLGQLNFLRTVMFQSADVMDGKHCPSFIDIAVYYHMRNASDSGEVINGFQQLSSASQNIYSGYIWDVQRPDARDTDMLVLQK